MPDKSRQVRRNKTVDADEADDNAEGDVPPGSMRSCLMAGVRGLPAPPRPTRWTCRIVGGQMAMASGSICRGRPVTAPRTGRGQ